MVDRTAEHDPALDQTERSIGAFLRSCVAGDEAAVRETHGGNLSFELVTIVSVDEGLSQLYTALAGYTGGAWYQKNGRSCLYPTGTSHLVEPTLAVRAFIKRYPRGFSGWYGSIPP